MCSQLFFPIIFSVKKLDSAESRTKTAWKNGIWVGAVHQNKWKEEKKKKKKSALL